jgi:hypothetical protein
VQINPDHTLTIDRTPVDYALMAMKYAASSSSPAARATSWAAW